MFFSNIKGSTVKEISSTEKQFSNCFFWVICFLFVVFGIVLGTMKLYKSNILHDMKELNNHSRFFKIFEHLRSYTIILLFVVVFLFCVLTIVISVLKWNQNKI